MVVHGRRGQRAVVLLDDLLRLPNFELVAPTASEADAAYAAFVAYGKGSGHPAGLNFGDVFSYALAKVRGLPLLYRAPILPKPIYRVRLLQDRISGRHETARRS